MTTCALCPKTIDTRRKYCPSCSRKARYANNLAATQRSRERQKATRAPTRKPCAYSECKALFVLSHPAQRYCTGDCRDARTRQAASEWVRRKRLALVMARHGMKA